MSAQGPFGDDQPDPFAALGGLFGDLARLGAQQGPLHWDSARQLAYSVATGGQPEPNVDPLARIAIEPLARVAELHVARVTGLSTSQTGRPVTVEPVTRTQWATTALDDYRPWFDALARSLGPGAAAAPAADDPAAAGDPLGFLAPLLSMMAPVMLGATAGSMVGHLARRSFGQYDLPLPRPRRDTIGVVLANVDEFGESWSLPVDDLRLWVCIHEVAHHAVLGVPHVRERIESLLGSYLSAFEPSDAGLEERFAGLDLGDPTSLDGLQELFADPQVVLGAIRSPAQAELLPRFEALVAVVVGVVDHTMDQVGAGLIGTYAQVTEAVRRRRVEASPADRFVERLLGLELTPAQVDRGQAFVRGVLERGGEPALARLWASERELPTPAEVDAPGLWLARIDLPD